MKKQALFSVSSAAITNNSVMEYLSPLYKANISNMLSMLKKYLGQVDSVNAHPYRVSRTNYVKVKLEGTQNQFYLIIELSGYTEIPEFSAPTSRLHINVNDAIDAYWLVQLLKKELCTTFVDNSM